MKKIYKVAGLLLFGFGFTANLGEITAENISKKHKIEVVNPILNGQPAPKFTLKDIDGNKVSLQSLKGKVVYMDIWASWCAPCLLQIKKSTALKEHFKNNKDVVFLYVSIDKTEENWKKAVEKRHIKGINVYSKEGADNDIVSNYNVRSIPKFVLINKEGIVVDENAKAPSDKALITDIENLL